MKPITNVDPNKVDELIDQVYEAFQTHCEEIHAETVKRINETAEDDFEKRKQILLEQKEQLDKTLAELKQVLNDITRQAREKLEEMEKKETEKEFNLDKELANI